MGAPLGFSRCGRASVSVEAALVLPVMLIFLLGIYEITTLYRTNMKLIAAANAMASMVAEQTGDVTPGATGSMGNFCTGAQRMILPQTSTLALAVASVTNNNGAIARDWETDVSCSATAGAIGAAGAVALASSPAALAANAGDSVIIVKASLNYVALTSFVLSPSYVLTATAWARPRGNKAITCPSC